MMRGLLFVVAWIFSVGAVSVMAQEGAGLSDVERKQVNDWMAERAESMVRAHKLESEIHGAWADTRYSSAEIESLRKRYSELQQELVRTQQEIQKKVQEVPAVQEKARLLEEDKKKEQELTKRINEKAGEKR